MASSTSERPRLVLGSMQFGVPADPSKNDARIADADAVLAVVTQFAAGGGQEIDTARMYNGGNTETLLGQLLPSLSGELRIASKAFPPLDRASVRQQLADSLAALGVEQLDVFYLHWPDRTTDLDETLAAVHALHVEGKFKRFGLSNYAAWEVADIVGRCRSRGYSPPVVYQGMYCAVNRTVEAELLPCLRHYGIAFYAYNPLAGGLLTGRYLDYDADPHSGRFSSRTLWGQNYRRRYWHKDVFAALNQLDQQCAAAGLSMADASLRWLANHAMLRHPDDAIIIGVSSLAHLHTNLAALSAFKPLPLAVLQCFDQLWQAAKPHAQTYWR